ncbi:MAG: CHC2 zinc finger domain-containing protein [Chitinophagaceae bacterium]
MDIADIKQHLTITQVLQHYGLTPDKNQRLNCPFHPDKTPSLQVYPKTNTFCCFSSNCTAGTGDQIQFIELMEKGSKHEALTKAAAMVNKVEGVGQKVEGEARRFITTEPLEKIAILTKAFKTFTKALPVTKKAVEYLQSRGLDYKLHEVGYISAQYHKELTKEFIESLAKQGLLKPLPAKGYSPWAKDCVVFPLKNQENKIVSLYGRSTTNQSDSKHFYLSNRSGLYPGYPSLQTKQLILTESIIDAASLLQQVEHPGLRAGEAIKSSYTILSLYGTNGLTEEHLKAIIELPQLEEIILMLDADDAGKAATAKHYSTIKNLLPHVRITCVPLPEGEDINSVLCTHDNPEVLQNLVDSRTDFSFSSEKESPAAEAIPADTSRLTTDGSRFITTNPELLIYDNCELRIEVWGGIKITGLDRMKVTLKVLHKQRSGLLPVRHSFDLYHRQQTEQLIQTIGESFDMNIKKIETTIGAFTNELENYRLQKLEALQPKEKTGHELTAGQKTAAINELKKPNLLQRTNEMIGLTGITGEEQNRLIAYLTYCTRKQPIPLHVMFLGSSGSGKTYLQEKISELVPEDDKIEITQITENALYYFKQEELKNKLILIEDLDGAMTVFYPLRELQTKRRISKTVTLKDSKGNLKTVTIMVEGPVCVSGCTTKEKIYEDNANRCILLYTDQTRDQDKRINEYQTKLSGGEVNRDREQQYKELFKNIQRVLRPINIVNPYAKYIALPEQVFKPRRTMTLLLGFIEAVTFYHQYQREVKKDANGMYITTTIEDIESSFNLLKDVLFSKSDELTKAAREFLELLKAQGIQSFAAKEIRQKLRLNPSNLKRYLIELERYGYLKGKGNRYRNYEYHIVSMDEYEQLKSSIDRHLQDIVTAIKAI